MRVLQRVLSQASATRKIDKPGMAIAVTLAMLLGMAAPVRSQTPAAKRTVIRAGHVLDVRTGQLLANQAIVIDGDKITKIAPASEVKSADGDTTIELPDATLLPGLIDMHTHLTFDLNSLGYSGLGISTAREALHGARNAKRTLDRKSVV